MITESERSYIRLRKEKGRCKGEHRLVEGLLVTRCPFCKRGRHFTSWKVGGRCRVCTTVIDEVFISRRDRFFIAFNSKCEKEFFSAKTGTCAGGGIAYWLKQNAQACYV